MNHEIGTMLAIPRPRTLAECGREARPCPWFGCRYHLAIEVASLKVASPKDPRATTIRLNMRRRDGGRQGRRPGLQPGSAAHIVRGWIEDALELLTHQEHTCAFDVVRDYPDGMPASLLAVLLGVTVAAIEKEIRGAYLRYRIRLERLTREGLT